MSDTSKLREVADHHQAEALERSKIARSRYIMAEKAEAAGDTRGAREYRAMGDAERKVAASQQAEADRLRTMADVYDEMPVAPAKT